MSTENLKELQEKAKGLKIEIQKDGKELTVEELKAAIEKAEEASSKKKEKSAEEIAQEKVEAEEKKVIAAVKKKKKQGQKTIKVLKSLAGKYLLSHTVGEYVNLEGKQAEEICEDGYGKEV
ncbi:hypothetical protein ACOKFD_15670 [Flagellimonas sp. S174]|uniref:hypothetical protein n=1 Tax=Flagellimonas sp. S174 TaxID=3410790 RepID=UPI003BF4938E